MEFKLDLNLGSLKRYQPFLPYVGVAAIILLTLSLLTSSLNKVSSLKEANIRLGQENKDLAGKLTQLESFVGKGLEEKIELALKALPRIDPIALQRFKQESRALAGVNHPNLVTLYELISDGETWFFSMELIEGVGFLQYVRLGIGGGEPGAHAPAAGETLSPLR